MIRLIGGVVARDSEAPVGEWLRAMFTWLPAAGDPVWAVDGPVGLFATRAAGEFARSQALLAVGDLDLANEHDLRRDVGTEPGQTGVLTGLYERDGVQLVNRLRGGFAVALWDRRERLLSLVVDRVGIRRLYYAVTPSALVFASRVSLLMGLPGVDRRLDPTAVFTYLNFGCIPAPASAFAGVRRIPPGCLLRMRGTQPVLSRYWDMRYTPEPVTRADSAAELYRVTEQAVAESVRGPMPKQVGAFLSGGTDSSTVVGLMARITDERVNAFSIGFGEKRYDELHYAELTARHFGVAHYTQCVGPDQALDGLARLLDGYDEPFGNNSAIGTYFCARLARDSGVTRLLAGDGGDEIFGGNTRYTQDRLFALYHRLPAAVRRGLIEPVLKALPPRAPWLLGRAQRYVGRAGIPNPRRFYLSEFFVAREADWLLTPDFLSCVDREAPYRVIQEHYERAGATEELNRLLYLDLRVTIGDNDLLKVTRTAELAGVEIRFPLLDHRLVEFTGTLPARFKVRGFEKRYLFKRAFRSLLPAETLAKRKHGFGVPTADWLRSDPRFRSLVRETLLSAVARQRGYFRPDAVQDLLARHDEEPSPYYGDILWTILMLELWHHHHGDRRAPG